MIIKKNGVSYELNKNNFTADIVYSPEAKGNIFIERSINYQSQEYVITSIQKESFKNNNRIFSIEFSKDSELSLICKNSFVNSSIQSISIPSSLEKLEDGWCKKIRGLNQFFLSPDNKIYKYLDADHKIIVKKSNPDEKDYDVLVFACRDIKRIIIPSTIKRICSYALSIFSIQKVEFDKNSKLESIGVGALSFNKLNKFVIPKSVKELDECWYSSLFNQTEILLEKENDFFRYFEGKMIVGKSTPQSEDFDVIVYANKNIEEVVIPSNIKYIKSYAFWNCRKLQKVEFSNDSKLISIGKLAFKFTAFESITIPSHVRTIKNNAFSNCNLKSIHFQPNSELYSIGKDAFVNLKIECISLQKNVTKLKDGWCRELKNLNKIILSAENKNFAYLDEEQKIIVGKSDQKSDMFDIIFFAARDIINVFIPSSIKYISSYAFADCKQLETVTFAENSQLEIFGDNSFYQSSLKYIKIPSSVQQICPFSFYNCKNLKVVELPENSQLKKIEASSFSKTLIEKLFFPSKLETFENSLVYQINLLNCIEISPENKNFKYMNENEKQIIVTKSDLKSDNFDVIVIGLRNLKKIIIPSTIKYISNCSFSNCRNLESIEFSKNSQLIEINEFAFCYSRFENIIIPNNVKYIGNNAFLYCQKLKLIEFEKNSKLEYFSDELFDNSNIESISIPSNVKELKQNWCSNIMNLKNISLESGNENFSYLDKERKIIVEKSEKSIDNFDVIVFASRDIKEANIPHSIKYIREHAFSYCLINKISIPNSVKEIGEYAFENCKYLNNVDFEVGMESINICDYAFYNSPIENLFVPAKKIEIGPSTFFRGHLKTIELLADELLIDSFSYCKKTFLVSFPNASKISLNSDSFFKISKDFFLFTRPDAILTLE